MEQFFGSASAEFEKMENIQDMVKLMWGLPVSQVNKPLTTEHYPCLINIVYHPLLNLLTNLHSLQWDSKVDSSLGSSVFCPEVLDLGTQGGPRAWPTVLRPTVQGLTVQGPTVQGPTFRDPTFQDPTPKEPFL